MSLSLDGAAGTFNAGKGVVNSMSASLTTAKTNDIVLAIGFAGAGGGTVTSVTDGASLVWHSRFNSAIGSRNMFCYWALAASLLSADSITVNMADIDTLVVFGVNGANTGSPFDTNGSLPATAAAASVTVSTSNANDFLFGFNAGGSAGIPAGWSNINAFLNSFNTAYDIVSSTLSGQSVNFGGGSMTYVDAIVAATPASLQYGFVGFDSSEMGRLHITNVGY
jgi:hypothetical protein